MKRDIDINEVSDGRLYGLNDMVKAGCDDCQGCSDCCHGMGSSIVLDPFDIYRLQDGTGMDFTGLLNQYLELNVVDGVILPNLRLGGEQEACLFLNEQERCSIHNFRPGICRLFPLGRIYEDGKVNYFLQIYECKKENRSKIKVKKWLDIPESKKYEGFVVDWHYFLNDVETLMEQQQDEEFCKNCNMFLLKLFYIAPYDVEQDFYQQFYCRFQEAKHGLFG